jgi:hypothetical protein
MSLNPYWTAILAEDTSRFILDPGIIALLIPITALVFGFATVIVKSVIRHRERMAKIGMGIDPDAPTVESGQPQHPRSYFGR